MALPEFVIGASNVHQLTSRRKPKRLIRLVLSMGGAFSSFSACELWHVVRRERAGALKFAGGKSEADFPMLELP